MTSASQPQDGAAAKLAFVDRMRGLAIIMVMVIHYGWNFTGPLYIPLTAAGQFGVQLFFFASAFTLSLSYDRRKGEHHAAGNFFIRRYFRIAPLYYLGMIAYGALALSKQQAEIYTPQNITAHLFFVHSLLPQVDGNLVGGGWTISDEMLFYLLFPLIYPAIDRAWQQHGYKALAGAVGAAFALSLAVQAGYLAATGHFIANNTFAYKSLPIQFPAFILGIAWYLAAWRDGEWRASPRRDWGWFIGIFALCMVIRAFAIVPLDALNPALAALSFVFLANILKSSRRAGGWLVQTGKVSYSVYVMHGIIILGFSHRVIGLLHGDRLAEALIFLPLLAFEIVLLVIAGKISKRLVEDRFVALARKIIARRESAAQAKVDALLL